MTDYFKNQLEVSDRDEYVWFHCRWCRRAFKQRDKLIIHRRKEHPKQLEKLKRKNEKQKKNERAKEEEEKRRITNLLGENDEFLHKSNKLEKNWNDVKISRSLSSDYKNLDVHFDNLSPEPLIAPVDTKINDASAYSQYMAELKTTVRQPIVLLKQPNKSLLKDILALKRIKISSYQVTKHYPPPSTVIHPDSISVNNVTISLMKQNAKKDEVIIDSLPLKLNHSKPSNSLPSRGIRNSVSKIAVDSITKFKRCAAPNFLVHFEKLRAKCEMTSRQSTDSSVSASSHRSNHARKCRSEQRKIGTIGKEERSQPRNHGDGKKSAFCNLQSSPRIRTDGSNRSRNQSKSSKITLKPNVSRAMTEREFETKAGEYKRYIKRTLKKGQSFFTCIICDKEFSSLWNIKVHIKGHTGERHFKCSRPTCHKTFITRYAEEAHQRKCKPSSSRRRQSSTVDDKVDESGPKSKQREEKWPFYDTSGILYCLCRYTSYGRMVECDNRNCSIGWFHFPCVNLTSDPIGDWFCPACIRPTKLADSRT